ncbi:N-acetylmuramic acid 6-phosphate etherase [Candidatus Kaiserbacteria bacterium]|nr:N-acetylmuramic acid 6-phosphate etherase [Candidatus Kaiserbacteria bacterium]
MIEHFDGLRHKQHTEGDESLHKDLEKMSTIELLRHINNEDKKVAEAVEKVIESQIVPLVDLIAEKMKNGGRLFYIGAGTSGRLGVLDASEIPPTFDMEGVVIGVMAGGYGALLKAVEGAEDNTEQGWKDLLAQQISESDIVIGIAASGKTPYVRAALEACKKNGIVTGCIVCLPNTEIAGIADYPIEVVVGKEVVDKSSRMKAGTAQKMVLNMISTTDMVKLGRVEGDQMIHMRPSNKKLRLRAIDMIMREPGLTEKEAIELLDLHGNAHNAIEAYKKSRSD